MTTILAVIMLLFLSVLPVFIIGLYIYLQDKNKEPIKLIIKLLLGGITSATITVAISLILGLFFDIFNANYTELNGIDLICYAFISVALIEEISKWIMLNKISHNNIEYDETYDMLLYGAFIGLGFAAIENIIYVFSYGTTTAITRAFTAVPMHTILGIIMGYYIGRYKEENNSSKKNMILSIVVPTMIHGIYDYCLMNNSQPLISITILIVTFIYSIILLKKARNKSVRIANNIYIEKYCPVCGTQYELKFCRNCGRKRK